MINGESNQIEDRLLKRLFLISNLEKIIEESVYYRTHSGNFSQPKIVIGKITDTSSSVKVL